jgi:hypothetical protein
VYENDRQHFLPTFYKALKELTPSLSEDNVFQLALWMDQNVLAAVEFLRRAARVKYYPRKVEFSGEGK